MLVSKDWLQTYFDQKLPEAERLADLLTMRAFEIEEIKGWDVDDILDIKVLPDRACYALCHKGIALEISVSAKMKLKENNFSVVKKTISDVPQIKIEEKDQCKRYIGRIVDNVSVKESPEWLRARIESIGERSINNLVDLANFVMFEINQPMHVFDADKVEGSIKVRLSKIGETMTTLDGKDVEFNSSVLVIADDKGPLAIAGIKGGNRAEVNKNTERIIVECANFDSSIIRNNSKIVDIKTSASKRFESNISPELAKEAMDYFSYLLSQEIKGVKFGEIVDVYPKKVEKTVIDFELEDINSSLGLNLKEDEVKSILEKFGFNFVSSKKTLKVEVPFERNDIKIKEDLVEEVGRIYGYENIPVQAVPSLRGRAMIGKDFYYIENIKNILNDLGFDEVSLYSLVSKGFFEIVYPLADDKKALREELSTGLIECISKNFQNLPILGLKAVKIFEIGRVFGKNGEKTHVCLGCQSVIGKNSRKNDEEFIQNALKIISEKLQVNFSFRVSSSEKGSVVEFDITESFVFSKSPDSYKDLNFENTSKNVFKHFSQYPFVLRDVALFVNNDDAQKEIEEMIKRICGDLLIRFDLFDVFKKKMEDGTEKNSYAYHLVFQSDKKTLTDIEVNEIMDRLYNELNAKSGWQVR